MIATELRHRLLPKPASLTGPKKNFRDGGDGQTKRCWVMKKICAQPNVCAKNKSNRVDSF